MCPSAVAGALISISSRAQATINLVLKSKIGQRTAPESATFSADTIKGAHRDVIRQEH